VNHLSGAPHYGRLLVLPTNIKVGWQSFIRNKHLSLL
jgi:hypothetical protein